MPSLSIINKKNSNSKKSGDSNNDADEDDDMFIENILVKKDVRKRRKDAKKTKPIEQFHSQ